MFVRVAKGLSNVLLRTLPLREIRGTSLTRMTNAIHTGEHRHDDKKDKSSSSSMSSSSTSSTSLMLHSFESAVRKKENYLDILRQYKSHNEARRGHVEFLHVALKYMKEFGVHRDLAVYKALLDVLPKGKLLPRNYFQTILMHYPKQQYVAIELLCKMEHNCVIPDVEMQDMLLNIFGMYGAPLKKFWRMMYWMPKFANLNPWPCPKPVPKDPRVLAKLAMSKVSSIDVCTKITEFETKDMEDTSENTWIVSVMSGLQEELLQTQSPSNPLFVEGPYTVWIVDHCIDYFVLRGEARKQKDEEENIDDVSNIKIRFWDKKEIVPATTVHEQDDGTYFAMCATGTSTKDSLLSWIRCLQERNPILKTIPVMFKLSSATKEQLYIDSNKSESLQQIN